MLRPITQTCNDSARDLWYQKNMTKPSRDKPLNVLFVCIGNSCRSQMAEAFANQHGGRRIRAWSAGSAPLGSITPLTYEVLREKGISLDGYWSKGMNDIPVNEMDVVVGMGCEVICPVPAGFKGRVIEWNIPDPYGRDAGYFRTIRDLIEREVMALLNDIEERRHMASKAPQAGV